MFLNWFLVQTREVFLQSFEVFQEIAKIKHEVKKGSQKWTHFNMNGESETFLYVCVSVCVLF